MITPDTAGSFSYPREKGGGVEPYRFDWQLSSTLLEFAGGWMPGTA